MATASRSVSDALKAVPVSGYRRDVVTLGMVTDVRVDGGTVGWICGRATRWRR
jgi:metal-sulfur cluster biosynthetic enzyme